MTQQLQSTNERMRPWITRDDKAAVMRVLDSGDLMSGREVAAFEEELAAYFGKRHAVCVSSGTAALECAMRTAAGSPPRPENFIAAFSAYCAAFGIHEYVEFARDGMGCDVLGEKAATGGWVHDCAHRFDKDAAHGRLSCFSFNANKFICCIGGVVITDHEQVAVWMRRYRNHGREGAEVFGDGRNLRMPEMNAALGRSQLRRIDDILSQRKMVARWYDKISGQKLADTRESWFLYPWPGQPALAKKHRSLADFRLFGAATQADRDTALLPIWPLMTMTDCEAACAL